MKFYGRLTPGILTSLAEPLELVVHQPRKASGLVVKIWEKASYTDIDGKFVEEGGEDDLLLELHGDVAPDPAFRKRGRGRFTVANVVAPTRDTKMPLGVLRVRVEGTETVHEAPIPSTEAELGGQNFEISITIEHGGAEVFRSKVTTFIRPALANPRLRGKRLLGFRDGQPIHDEDDEVVLIGRYATIGTCSSQDDDGKLVVLGYAVVTDDGRLAPCGEDGAPLPGELMLLRTHRDLWAYVTREVPKSARTVGESPISIRLCHEIEPDGTVQLDVAEPTHLYDLHTPGMQEEP